MRVEVTLEILETLIKQYEEIPGAQVPRISRFLYEKLSAMGETANKLAALDRKKNDLIESHKDQLDTLDMERAKVQGHCFHYLKKYVPDPSGNNDSYWLCETCGKEVGP